MTDAELSGLSTAEIIESWFPRAFQSKSGYLAASSASVRVSLSGPEGGQWDVSVTGDGMSVDRREVLPGRRPEGENPDIWLRQSAPDFRAVFVPDPDLPVLLPAGPASIIDLLCLDERGAELLAKVDGRLKYEIEGRRRRRWAIDVAFGPSGMRAGQPRSTVRVDGGICEKLANREMTPLQALVGGRLRVEGDRGFLMQVLLLVGARLSPQ